MGKSRIRAVGNFTDMETVNEDLKAVIAGGAKRFSADEQKILDALMNLPEKERRTIRNKFIKPTNNPLADLNEKQKEVCQRLIAIKRTKREKILVRTVVLEILREDDSISHS